MTHLEFLGETLGAFEALAILAQVLCPVRVASSPDFNVRQLVRYRTIALRLRVISTTGAAQNVTQIGATCKLTP